MRFALVVVLVLGCATDDSVANKDPADPGEDPIGQADPQLPPRGHAPLKAWLAEGHYESWACEEAPHPARPPGAHGTNRICSNTALSTSPDGVYPIGAASVKELWQNGRVTGFAVAVKLTASADASSWYWYEAFGDSVIADGVNKGICVNCHSGAPRDYIFTHVR